MDKLDLQSILNQEECEFLEFKVQYHDNTMNLLHDILCLANSYYDGTRYLLFGIEDKTKKIVGVENDSNRKVNAHFQDLLRESNLNRIPSVSLETIKIENHEIDILIIKNRPDKPFFLLKDKNNRKGTIRNGVIYTRLGDTNTPLKETATEANIEMMWRERFGFDLPPLELFNKIVENPNDWEKSCDDNYIYHHERPEFVIKDGETINPNFNEPWTDTFHNVQADSFYVCIYYLTTLLLKVTFVNCDEGRYRIPLPVKVDDKFHIDRNSIEWKIAQIYRQDYPLDEQRLQTHGIYLI